MNVKREPINTTTVINFNSKPTVVFVNEEETKGGCLQPQTNFLQHPTASYNSQSVSHLLRRSGYGSGMFVWRRGEARVPGENPPRERENRPENSPQARKGTRELLANHNPTVSPSAADISVHQRTMLSSVDGLHPKQRGVENGSVDLQRQRPNHSETRQSGTHLTPASGRLQSHVTSITDV